jgi:hypothetical protein
LAVRPLPAGRLEGAVNGGPYEVQCQARRRLVPLRSNSVGDVVTVPARGAAVAGMAAQGYSDGEDRSRRPDVTA